VAVGDASFAVLPRCAFGQPPGQSQVETTHSLSPQHPNGQIPTQTETNIYTHTLHQQSNSLAKGDVLTVAKLAGIMGAKCTSQLIPLCHTLLLSKVSNPAGHLASSGCAVGAAARSERLHGFRFFQGCVLPQTLLLCCLAVAATEQSRSHLNPPHPRHRRINDKPLCAAATTPTRRWTSPSPSTPRRTPSSLVVWRAPSVRPGWRWRR